MKYWSIHLSVLTQGYCIIPMANTITCRSFLGGVRRDCNQVVALDKEGLIERQYMEIARQDSDIKDWLKYILQTAGKCKDFRSRLRPRSREAFRRAGIGNHDMAYFGVASNPSCVLAHSSAFPDTILVITRRHRIKVCNLPTDSWRS